MKWFPSRCIRCVNTHFQHVEGECPCETCAHHGKPVLIEERQGAYWTKGLEIMQGVRQSVLSRNSRNTAG